MRWTKWKRRGFAGSLAGLWLISGCGGIQARDLAEDVEPAVITGQTCGNGVLAEEEGAGGDPATESGQMVIDEKIGMAVTDFAVRLLREQMKEGEENELLSPVSMVSALGMTANGAQGETREQMEEVMGASAEALNFCLQSCREASGQEEEGVLHLANSIWFLDDGKFQLKEDFLRTNAAYYGASLYGAPFDDTTRKDINRWVKRETDGMIEEIVREIPPLAVMYLVNALSFEAQWQDPYEDVSVDDGVFFGADGQEEMVEMMRSEEYQYFADEDARGFIKSYQGGRYAFAALLPGEGMDLETYVNQLDGMWLYQALREPENKTVLATMPKFETEDEIQGDELLKNMGMTDAFDADLADFGGIGTYAEDNLYISSVLQKTYLQVDQKGTKGGAATAVELSSESAAAQEETEKVEICLDRPFLYVIFERESGLPLFLGLMDRPV